MSDADNDIIIKQICDKVRIPWWVFSSYSWAEDDHHLLSGRDEVFAGVVSISLLQVIILHSHPSILTTSTSPYPPYQHTSLSYILLPTYNVEHKIIFLTVEM